MPDDDVTKVRIARAELGKRLQRLVRDGMAVATIEEAEPGNPDSDYVVMAIRRTEIRGGI